MHMHQQNGKKRHLEISLNEPNLSVLMKVNKKMKQLMKVFQEINKLINIKSQLSQQELDDSHSKNRN